MATFTLTGNIDDLTGDDTRRITTLMVTPTFPISDPVTGITWERTTRKKVTGGEFEWELPADSLPTDYGFLVEAPQLQMRWYVPQQAASSTVDLSEFTDVSPVIDPLITLADINAALALGATNSALIAGYATGESRIFEVKAYGAVGNGSTDDTTNIQTALAAARAVKGTVRFEPNKTYIVSAALNPGGTRVEGFGATVKIKSSTTPAYSVIVPTTGCVIEGLTIDCNKAGTTDPGNQLHGNGFLMNQTTWTGLVLRNVKVMNSHQIGVHIYSATGGTSGGATADCPTLLDNVTVTGCDEANFSVKLVSQVVVRDCISEGSPASGFYMSVVGNVHITGLRSNTNDSGLFCEYGENVTIEGSHFEGNTQWGIAIGGGSVTLQENRYITLTGNVCRGNGAMGITLDPTKAGAPNTWVAMYATLTGNVCQSNAGGGINLENVGYVSLTGNVCHGNTGAGLRIVGAYATVAGNICTSNTTYGLALYGVSTFDNGHHTFGANTVLGNTTGQYDIASIAGGTVLDVVNTMPGAVKGTGNVHAAINTAQEVWMGPAGPGGQAGIDIYGQKLYAPSAGILRTPGWLQVDGNLVAGQGSSGGWNVGHLLIGSYHLWVDSTGDLRIKSSTPASDLDGTVVGTQS